MICALCGSATEAARTLKGKAICSACLGALVDSGPPTAIGTEGGNTKSKKKPAVVGEKVKTTRPGAQILSALNLELARLKVAEEDLGPNDCIVARKHGKLFQLSDGSAPVVAPGEKLLERLQSLPDGAGLQATWWMVADL